MVHADGDPVIGAMLAWYAVSTYSGYEKQVKRSLEDRVAQNNVQDKITEVMIPQEQIVEMKAGKKRKAERKFFPGYVLVRMEMDDDTWHLIKNVPRVVGFVGASMENNLRPRPLSDAEIANIQKRMSEGSSKVGPEILFEAGEEVRVTDGPFNDFSGMVEEVNYEKSKLLVLVQIFGRSTPVELDFTQVEKS